MVCSLVGFSVPLYKVCYPSCLGLMYHAKIWRKPVFSLSPIAAGYLPGAYSVPIDLSYWTFSLFAIFRVSRWCCTPDHIEQALNFNEVALISVQQHYMNLCFA